LILDAKGEVLATTHPELAQSHQFSQEFLVRALKKPALGDVYKHPTTGEVGFLAAAPIRQTKDAAAMGIVVNRIDTKNLNATMLKNIKEFGESGEFYLINKNGYRITESRD
jgi:hypothetical protein